MYEHKRQKLLPIPRFIKRVAISFAISSVIVIFALGNGIVGYHFVAHLSLLDALLNATMILTGMGPVAQMVTPGAKLFASGYALFSGVVFLSAMGIVLSPIFHRIMHMVHLDESAK